MCALFSWAKGSPPKIFTRTIPSPLRERVRVRGSMRLRRWFRSPQVPCFSARPEPVNVPGGLAASPLATPAPGKKNRRFAVTLSLFLQAFGSGTSLHPCRLCPLGASLRLAPAFRKRFGDFQPDQGVAVSPLLSGDYFIALKAIKLLRIPLPRGRGHQIAPAPPDCPAALRLPGLQSQRQGL